MQQADAVALPPEAVEAAAVVVARREPLRRQLRQPRQPLPQLVVAEVVVAVAVEARPQRRAERQPRQAASKRPRSCPTTLPVGRFPCKWASK